MFKYKTSQKTHHLPTNFGTLAGQLNTLGPDLVVNDPEKMKHLDFSAERRHHVSIKAPQV